MAYPPAYTFSKPVSYSADPEFDHAVRFAVDKRDNALMPELRAHGSHVVNVSNDPGGIQWEQALQSVGAAVLGQMPGNAGLMVRAAYIRSALRPAGQGAGRDRFR